MSGLGTRVPALARPALRAGLPALTGFDRPPISHRCRRDHRCRAVENYVVPRLPASPAPTTTEITSAAPVGGWMFDRTQHHGRHDDPLPSAASASAQPMRPELALLRNRTSSRCSRVGPAVIKMLGMPTLLLWPGPDLFATRPIVVTRVGERRKTVCHTYYERPKIVRRSASDCARIPFHPVCRRSRGGVLLFPRGQPRVGRPRRVQRARQGLGEGARREARVRRRAPGRHAAQAPADQPRADPAFAGRRAGCGSREQPGVPASEGEPVSRCAQPDDDTERLPGPLRRWPGRQCRRHVRRIGERLADR